MMERKYGEIIFEKGTILYALHDLEFNDCNQFDTTNKLMLFCTCHPSESDILCKYVHQIKLLKDIKLLFLIKDTKRGQIQSFTEFISNESGIEYKVNIMTGYKLFK